MNKRFINTLAAFLIGCSALVSANNTLILDTLYEQGVKFISIESLSGRSASAFSVYKMMSRTDAAHPKTHAFAMLLDTATKQQVMTLSQSGDSLAADRLKLEYLSMQYEVGATPSNWASIKQDFSAKQQTKPAVVNTVTPQITPANLEAKNQLSSRQVRTLVSNTKTYLRQKQFFAPANKNAFHNIQRVLRDDPKNTKAIGQYFSLLEKVSDEVNNLLGDGDIGKAISLTEQGLTAIPDHALLNELNGKAMGYFNFEQQINAFHDPNAYMPELASNTESALIKNGKTYLTRKQFFQPASSNAYAKFKRVLSSEPNNSKARSGMLKLIKEVDEEIDELIEDGKFAQAQALLQQGLDVVPEQVAWQSKFFQLDSLMALQQKRIDYAQANYSATLSSRSQKALLSNAKSYTRSGNFFGSDNKNANTALHRVLATEPESTKVLAGFEDLIEKVNETAVELAEDGELNRAASLINQALTFHSGHPSLTIMGGNLNSLMAVIQ